MRIFNRRVLAFAVICYVLLNPRNLSAEPASRDVLTAMKKASDFMANTVSNHGGYVSRYSADLSKKWGEIQARPSQIMVQPPGTTTVGMVFLEAYKTTGDSDYLEYARRAANALVWGQHPAGGWHYLIDFDMTGIRKWYKEFASKCWGWEEYLHYYGNCTFDDDATTAPAKYLLDLYMVTLDPQYRTPLIRALDFILESQYPNGAWPQRYPLMDEHIHGGHPDYTSCYTFNDGVIKNNIMILLEAWNKLGNEKYRKAALRGMDFYIISQLPKPRAGWADQYDMDLKPAWGRSYEPPALSSGLTARIISDLETFYMITGDRKYLNPIPDALDWLESAVINTDPAINYTHAYYYEPGTNRPLYTHREGTGVEDERYWHDHDMNNLYPYGRPYVLQVRKIRDEYERLKSLSPEEAMAEYEAGTKARLNIPAVDPDEVDEIISSMDKRGVWITEFQVPQNYFGDVFKTPWRTVWGIEIQVFQRNMQTLVNYLKRKRLEK